MTILPPLLLQGLRQHLADPQAQVLDVQRQHLTGGLSGSRLERWRLHIQGQRGERQLKLIYKQGAVVSGAFMQGAPQREALALLTLPSRVPLTMPQIVAADARQGDIWMTPFPPSKPTSHWQAAWDDADVRAVITDLARMHAAFWGQDEQARAWPWLLRPTTQDAARLLAEAQTGLAQLQAEGAFDASLTPERVQRLLALARSPHPLLTILNDGPVTLLHGDAGFQNIAITQDGRQRIWYDWQLVAWGPPALDWATFVHPWAYPEAHPPLSPPQMLDLYLQTLADQDCPMPRETFLPQLDAALVWRWLLQWAPLFSSHRHRLRPHIRARLTAVFTQWHWPALDRLIRKHPEFGVKRTKT